MKKVLARIEKAEFGIGGYQDAMIGLSLSFQSKSGTWQTFDGLWAEPKTDEAIVKLGCVLCNLHKYLVAAKAKTVKDLVGKPVELEVDEGLNLQDWRILEEVL